MLDMECKATLRGALTSECDNPLWVATEQAGVLRGRGEHATHLSRLLPSAPFMEYKHPQLLGSDQHVCKPDTAHKVLAGRYCPRKRKKKGGPCYQIWWLDKSVTWEPKWCLNTLDRRFLDKLHSQQRERVKFTGSVGVETGSCAETFHHVLGVNSLSCRTVSPLTIIHQKHGSHCALNSVANGIGVPAILYDAIFAVDPPLEQVITRLRQKVGVLTKVGIPDGQLLAWLLAKKEGVYEVESDGASPGTVTGSWLWTRTPNFPVPWQPPVPRSCVWVLLPC